MTAVQLANDLAGGDVQRGVQARRAVALVVMGRALGRARQHRESTFRTTRRLDPAKPGEMSQVSGGEVELVDVVADRLVESVEVAA
jgi:hypothetical protein